MPSTNRRPSREVMNMINSDSFRDTVLDPSNVRLGDLTKVVDESGLADSVGNVATTIAVYDKYAVILADTPQPERLSEGTLSRVREDEDIRQ